MTQPTPIKAYSWIAKTPPTLTVYSVSLTECKTHISILISVFPTAIWKEKIDRIAIDSVDRIAKRNIYMTLKANGAIACYIIADFGSKGNFLQHTGASHWKSGFWFSFLGCGLDISSLKGFFPTLADKTPWPPCALEKVGGISNSSGSDVKYS